jgi:two-component system KDP operon response regulator KdpE
MSGKKILLVDDDNVILKALSFKLKARGLEVVTAADGSTAVSLVRTQRPDLILLDLTFQPEFGSVEWDGFRIMDWLKRIEEAAHIPIVVVSSGEAAKYEARTRDAGAVAYFQKPVDYDRLFEVIEKELEGTRAS